MKLCIGFMLICFVAAIGLQKRDLRTNMWMVFGLALVVSVGYYFFRQI